MTRQPEREQLNRLTTKTPNQVFIMRVKETQALTDLIEEGYFSWLAQPKATQTGKPAMTVILADELGHKPLSKCKMVLVVLTLYAGEEDHEYRLVQKGGWAIVRAAPQYCHLSGTPVDRHVELRLPAPLSFCHESAISRFDNPPAI